MANKATQDPLILDTTFSSPLASTRISSGDIRATKIEWKSPTTIGHNFTITDNATTPKTLLEGTCEVALQSQVWTFVRPLILKQNGWNVPTLDSGKLEIWF